MKAEDFEDKSRFEHVGSYYLSDVLSRVDNIDEFTVDKHDCRADVPMRTGICRAIGRTDGGPPTWTFDPMVAVKGTFLYIIKFCPYCGTMLGVHA